MVFQKFQFKDKSVFRTLKFNLNLSTEIELKKNKNLSDL